MPLVKLAGTPPAGSIHMARVDIPLVSLSGYDEPAGVR